MSPKEAGERKTEAFDIANAVNGSAPQKSLGCNIAITVGVILFNLGVALCLGLLVRETVWRVHNASRMCDKDHESFSTYKSPPTQTLNTWFYNITNPLEYATGSTAEVHERGPWAWNLNTKRSNVDFNNKEDTIFFDIWYKLGFKKSSSCKTCGSQNDRIYVLNPGMQSLMQNAKSEALMLLSGVCTPTQIQLIYNPSAPYCAQNEWGTSATCRCCSTERTPSSGFSCSAIANKGSKQGGLFSWLAKYDGGLQLSTTSNSNFPLSTGDYTFNIRETTPSQVMMGSSSVFLGTVSAITAIKSGDVTSQYTYANTTNDMKEICMALYCPSLASIVADIQANPSATVAILRAVSCYGFVPSKDDLVKEHGFSEERAQSLAYLEGSNCNTFVPSLVLAAQITVTSGSTYQCVDGGAIPCCLKSFSAGSLSGVGIGCLTYFPGIFIPRRVESAEEASLYFDPYTEMKTGCAKGYEYKFEQTVWRGRDEYNQWVTPATYAYPNMPWSDPTIVAQGLMNPPVGEVTVFNVSGKQLNINSGTGMKNIFLNKQLSDGEPKNKAFNLFVPYRLRSQPLNYDSKSSVRGLDTNKFKMVLSTPTNDAEIEESQRNGEVPYWNMFNLVYAAGKPLISSFPNYYASSNEMLSQDDNSARGSASTSGVKLYRAMDKYNKNADLLAEPEEITPAVLSENSNAYSGFLNIEPATGVSLGGEVVNMFSTFTWNCNPAIANQLCSIMNVTYNAAAPMCYPHSATDSMYPCSNANVFTPYMQGSKVVPLFWIRVQPDLPGDIYSQFHKALDLRFAFQILILIVPTLSAIGLGWLWYSYNNAKGVSGSTKNLIAV